MFGIMKDGSFMLHSKQHQLFHMQNFIQNGANDISEMFNIISRFFVKEIQILYSSDYSILFKFCQLVVKIVSKGLQIVI